MYVYYTLKYTSTCIEKTPYEKISFALNILYK